MKKLIAMLLLAAMLLTNCATAAGLLGLDLPSGGLDDLFPTDNANDGVLPDPAELLGEDGRVIADNYEYAVNYICTVYGYAIPGDTEAFVAAYTQQAQDNGFTVESAEVDGCPGYCFSHSTGRAYIVPEYNGCMLLLVENGMNFGKPRPEGQYLWVEYNGRELEMQTMTVNEEQDYHCDRFSIFGNFERAPISYIGLTFPNYSIEGDTYYCDHKKAINELTFYTNEHGYIVYEDSPSNGMTESGDYFEVKITRMFEDNGKLYMEGTFSASFYGGSMLFENGEFRIKVPN